MRGVKNDVRWHYDSGSILRIRGIIMKKLAALAILSGTLAFTVPAAEAATSATASAGDPQIRVQIGRNTRWNRNRRARTTVTTRITQVGRYRYRETIRTTYMPNGRT